MMCTLRRLLIAGLTLLVAAAHADVVGHWKFDETTGTTVADSSPGNNPGTITGTATFGPGINGNCLQVPSGGGWVRMGNILNLTNQPFTMSAWVNTTSNAHQIVVGRHYATIVAGYFIATGAGAGYGIANKGYLYQSNLPGAEPISTSDVVTGTWKHIVTVYDPGQPSKIYIDGVFEASKPSVGMSSANADFAVAGLNSNAGYYNSFVGGVDDVQVYNRALSDAEIAYLFNNPGKESWHVSGQIKQNSVGVPGCLVRVKQGTTVMATGMTDANGYYAIGGLEVGSYTIEPYHDDKYFFPATKDVTLAPDATVQNFTATNIGPISVTFEHAVVYSDQSRRGILGLNVPTPVDRPVTMSDNSFKLTSPILVTVPAGIRTKDFFVYGVTVAADVLVTVTATTQGVTATGQITVRQKPALTGITLASTVKGGRGISGFCTIDKPAIGAMSLKINSSDTNLAVISPSNTAMPNGAVNKAFYCKTFPVATNQILTVTATFYGSTATKQVTVTP